jgi:hypothetical protein
MKYNSWEDMVDAQAIAFCSMCARDSRLSELTNKSDENGFNSLSKAEQDEFFSLSEDVMNNPFFSRRCMNESEEMDMQEHPIMPDEEPNNWDKLEHESYMDLFGHWWE